MDLTVAKSELIKLINITQNVVERRTTMPILANVLISATDGKLKISASDLEITAVAQGSAHVNSPGSTTVNARVFCDLVKELPEDEVRIKLSEGERLEITSRKSKFRINGVSAEEYPSLPGVGFEVKGRIGSKAFLEMINRTLYAVSQDETRFNLNGVCFEIVGEGKKGQKALRMVATDGHRLSLIARGIGEFDFKGRVIVPRKGLNEIKKILDTSEDVPTGIDISDGFLVLESRDAKVSMRLIDAEYPDYNQVIPKQKGVLAIVPSAELVQSLRRVALMVTDKGKCVRMDFNKDSLRIVSSSPELGDASEEVSLRYEGKPLSVGFNAKYLLDFALSLEEEQNIVIELNGELGPGKFYAENDESYFGIVMPMRLSA
ncbi:MAG: DNA polymerase III subunit beta [Deltaproteobacteria bacterium]|nr:DNA polymerase III subunit beta [Deltaproteobacteria bacterium]